MPEEESMESLVLSGVALDESQARVAIKNIPDNPGVAGFIFTRLGEANINVDMIVQSSAKEGKNDISFTVREEDLKEAKKTMEKIKQKLKGSDVSYNSDTAKVSLVGAGMQSHPGVAARMFACLGKKEINIEMINTSEIRISCIVKRKEAMRAVRAVHKEFELELNKEKEGLEKQNYGEEI
ncbi:MAG: ACT domain-containing protein [Candidatus Aerophobetes bacterium]|nr:ACT domain-containing protein [Candidatus Aerophobetes bacterium]